jgi:manganese/zinc/iron transport system permease protein
MPEIALKNDRSKREQEKNSAHPENQRPLSSAADRRVWALIGSIALLAVLFIPFSQMALGVSYNHTLRVVALGGALLGAVSGALGTFAVLRRQSLMGDALSHAALPGVAIAFLLAGRELGFLLIGAGVASWLGVHFIRRLTDTTRIKQDTAMGIVLASWFAAGIALLAYIQARPDASQAGLDTFIFGQAAAIVESDVRLIALVGLASFVLLALFWKEFKLITFDAAFAGANGYRVNILNMFLSTLIVVAIVLGLQLAGVILMVGMLIAPGIAARQWTDKLEQMVILAAVMGAFAGGAGAIISAVDANLPTGPMIIVVAFALVAVSIAFAPGRGLLWATLRRRRDRRRFAAQTILQDLYRYALDHGGANTPVPAAFLRGVRGDAAGIGLKQLRQRGHARKQGAAWVLSEEGAARAAAAAHNQRLWEMYHQYGDELGLPPVGEKRQRPIAESLSAEAIAELERKLEGTAV